MSPSRRLRLTPQQAEIVAHNHGPALVYAVAGAGKTTALVHRIARLVREDLFPAKAILATSFNRDANRGLRAGLAPWPGCAQVQVRTLHSLGYSVVQLAHSRGYLPHIQELTPQGAGVQQRLLATAIQQARSQRVGYAPLLDDLESEAFLTFVGACKGQLAYLGRSPSHLPRSARKCTRTVQAPAHAPWYGDLYRRYEEARLRAGLLTFDDMLMTGWEMLVRHPDVLETVRRRYACVLVDEFQDVNRAQAEMLDLITAPHGNYMAVGDDDQAIYGWRGAAPAHLLNFRRRYRARVYLMTDNFRSTAPIVALANQVIQHNRQRQPKAVALTRGFGGLAEVHPAADEATMAVELAAHVQAARSRGHSLAQQAVLVRFYAQAEPLIQALRSAGVACRLDHDQATAAENAGALTVTSIYKAKGLEWPVVHLPDCNDGILPPARNHDPEEERRLFYVAVTRARQELHLYARQDRPLSPFLEEANYAHVLAAVESMAHALRRSPETWSVEEYVAVGINAKRLYLLGYLAQWWDRPAKQRQAVAMAVLRFYATLRARRLFRPLGLTRRDRRFWEQLAGPHPRPAPLDLPGLEALLPRPG